MTKVCPVCRRDGETVEIEPYEDTLRLSGGWPLPAVTWECPVRDSSLDISHWKRTDPVGHAV